jgi:hypothetical protein
MPLASPKDQLHAKVYIFGDELAVIAERIMEEL